MKLQRLTKEIVDSLAPSDADYVAWCGKLPGFGCRVRPTGHKSFIAQYRSGGRNATPRKVTIGAFGKITVEQARKLALEILAKAELGNDVAAERARVRAEITVSQLCDEYLLEGVDKKKESTIKTDRSRIERHIRPLLGRKRIGEISRADVAKFLRDVANGKTARNVKTGKHGRSIVRGGKGAATRTVRLLGGIFTYAVRCDYLRENPCRGVELYRDGRGERFLSIEEFRRLGASLRMAESEGLPWTFNEGAKAKHRPKKLKNQRELVSPYVIAAIRLLLLTGCRLREILHLKWTEVDLDRGILTLSDSKTGRKPVLLPSQAVLILHDLPKIGPYVIAGKSPDKPRTDVHRPWSRITKHANLPKLRLHDLRHSFASVGAASGLGLVGIGKLLGHRSASTTSRYAHLGDDPLRRASQLIAGTISHAIEGQISSDVRDALGVETTTRESPSRRAKM